MKTLLHITSGDFAGRQLEQTGLPGDFFVWHDVLYDGPRNPGWPTQQTLQARATYLEDLTAGGLKHKEVLQTLQAQYQKLSSAGNYNQIVLWFDACLFDQSMLAHILTCLDHLGLDDAELLCVDNFPEIVPYHGLGQLNPEQLASVYDLRKPVTTSQYQFATKVDEAFATQNQNLFADLSSDDNSPLPWVAAAVRRWLQECPNAEQDLGLLEQLALAAIVNGNEKPWDIFNAVAAVDTPPQYWGDITLWSKINALADHHPPLVHIDGPTERLPQWVDKDLSAYRIIPQ